MRKILKVNMNNQKNIVGIMMPLWVSRVICLFVYFFILYIIKQEVDRGLDGISILEYLGAAFWIFVGYFVFWKEDPEEKR
jgi:hypothetical protein